MNKITKRFSARAFTLVGSMSLLALVAGFGSWATLTEISGAIIASGRVEVDQNRQVVQHLDGGIVSKIMVQEGDVVERGDPLILLDEKLVRSEVSKLENQLFELMARHARLEAERDNENKITKNNKLVEAARINSDIRGFVAGQQRLFKARRLTLAQQVEQMNERKLQITDQIHGIQAQQEALEKQIDLIKQELASQEKLLKQGLTQAPKVLRLKRDKARLAGTLGELVASEAQAKGKITELNIEILNLRTSRREESISTLRDLQYRMLELEEELKVKLDRSDRLSIRAPVSGIVYGLKVFAEQSVVRPADPLLYIVPQDRPLFVAAKVEPIHVEQVYIGQDVSLRFSTFDQKTTPELRGTVNQISADVFTDEATGNGFYRAEIIVNEGELKKLPESLSLLPGMPVESFISTNKKTPIAYLVKPLADYFSKAFREE